MEEQSKMEGTVNWFNIKKGYGFVKGEDGKDYFVHYSAVPQGVFLKEGDRISFEPARTDKGEQAQNVQFLGEGEANHEEASEEQPEESNEQSEETQEESTEESEEQPEEAEETSEESEDENKEE
tara:strand:+ start:786 stop:1157 length:372 start_codon:yes stop_codon:yes gene_type:complete